MIKIEIDETKRKIEVARKAIEKVPNLSEKIVNLKNELDIERQREAKLSEDLENPENEKRWRELGGEDPDQESLEAKIQILEVLSLLV